jgi:hypothetical protein
MTLWHALMAQWIANKNSDDFCDRLADRTDPDRRRVLAKPIAREEPTLCEADGDRALSVR